MFEKGKISLYQFMSLVTLFTIGSSILLVPGALAAEAKQDGWISGIFALLLILVVVLLYHSLGNQYSNKTIVQYSELIFGRWIGKSVSFFYFIFLFILSATVIWDIANFMATQILVDTPIEALFILFLFIVVIGARLGVETIARSAEVFIPWVFLLFFSFMIFVFPQIEMVKMLPILEEGMKPILKGTLINFTIPYIQLVVFLMILPYVNNVKKAKNFFLWGVICGGSLLIIVTLICILVLGADLTARQAYPSYILARKVSVGEFLERIEVIMAILWMLSIYFKVVILYYASTLALAQILEVKDYRILTFPLALIIYVLTLLVFPNVSYSNEFASTSWVPYALTFGLGLPLLLKLVSKINKNKESKGENSKL